MVWLQSIIDRFKAILFYSIIIILILVMANIQSVLWIKKKYLSSESVESDEYTGNPVINNLMQISDIRFSKSDNIFYLSFSDDQYLDALDDPTDSSKSPKYCVFDHSNSQKWKLHKSIKGYNIVYNDKYALTYDEVTDQVSLNRFNDSENQRWIIEQAEKN